MARKAHVSKQKSSRGKRTSARASTVRRSKRSLFSRLKFW